MDGNGRWAKSRGLPRVMGHKQGAKVFERIVRHAKKRGVGFLTVYAFSTENRSRPADEVAAIKELLREFLGDIDKYKKDNARVHFVGDLRWLADEYMLARIDEIEQEYNEREECFTLNVAFNYGGRDELLRAAKALARESKDAGALTEDDFARHLYTAGQPDVDLVIRTSGEMRISNFLLWQAAYAEYVFCEKLWPDFTTDDFDAALDEYSSRERRNGGI
jgi:undecaprenyl diphosphate synthase